MDPSAFSESMWPPIIKVIGITNKKWPRKLDQIVGREPWSTGFGRRLCSKDREFESWHRILNEHPFTYLFVVKFVMCV